MTENNDEMLTIPQAAKYLGISRQQMYVWSLKLGLKRYKSALPHNGQGGLMYFKKSEIDAVKNTFIEVKKDKQ